MYMHKNRRSCGFFCFSYAILPAYPQIELFTFSAKPFFLRTFLFFNLANIDCLRSRFLSALSFVKERCQRKPSGGDPPEAVPPICAPHNFRAIRVAILLCYLAEMKSAGTWCRISTQNREIAPQWLLFYSLYAVQRAIR